MVKENKVDFVDSGAEYLGNIKNTFFGIFKAVWLFIKSLVGIEKIS